MPTALGGAVPGTVSHGINLLRLFRRTYSDQAIVQRKNLLNLLNTAILKITGSTRIQASAFTITLNRGLTNVNVRGLVFGT